MFFPKGCYVAVLSEDEHFWVACCSENITEKASTKKKIRWLERSKVDETGTIYVQGQEDTINFESIICSIKIVRQTRFKFLLTLTEEQQILSKIYSLVKVDEDITDFSENMPISEEYIPQTMAQSNLLKSSIESCYAEIPPKMDSGGNSITNDTKQKSEIETSPKIVVLNEIILKEDTQKQIKEMKVILEKDKKNCDINNPKYMVEPHSDDSGNISRNEKCEENFPVNLVEGSFKNTKPKRNIPKATYSFAESEEEPFQSSGSEFLPDYSSEKSILTNFSFNNTLPSFEKLRESCVLATSSPEYSIEKFSFAVSPIPSTLCSTSFPTVSNSFSPSNVPNTSSATNLNPAAVKEDTHPTSFSSGSSSPSQSEQENHIPETFPFDDTQQEKISSRAFISQAKKTAGGKRVYDKKHACYFCDKIIGKVSRHLELIHGSETEVMKILVKEKKSKERRQMLLCLQRAGDYYHNSRVLATKEGELILSRRPTMLIDHKSEHYGPCPNCLGFFHLDSLWRHVKKNCPLKNAMHTSNMNMRRDVRGESCALLSALSDTNLSIDFCKNILAFFRDDKISIICKQDQTILKLGALMFEKFSIHQYDYVRQTMRQLGRLLMEIMAIDQGITNLTQALQPKNFDLIILAIRKLCIKSSDNTQVYEIPSLALKLGHSLRKCAQIIRGTALRQGNLHIDREMKGFLDIMELEWKNRISSSALKTMVNRKMNCVQMLPVTEDIMKLNFFLDAQIEMFTKKFVDQIETSGTWQGLASAVLARIIIFNKRRSGEVSRMNLTQYACRPDWKDQSTSELKASLSDLERTLANRLTVVEVQGKSRKNPKVPVLLTPELKKAIDLLLEKRGVSNISQQNHYIFARSNPSLGYMRGHDCLKRYIAMIDLQKPDLITSTKLRKYVATTVQVFNLKETETDWLARHLGHDIRIHRDFYRLHESAVELTKVSRILLAIDSGQAATYAGKSLEDIRLEDLPEPENSDSENEDDKLEDNGRNEIQESDICDRTSKKSRPGLDLFDEEYLNLGRETENEKITTFSSSKSQKGVKIKVTTNTSIKKPWTSTEKNAVLTFFSRDIKKCIVPTKVTGEDCKKQSQGILDSRTWKDIKYCVHNHIVKMKKKT